jgi:hypothetical protein
MPIAYIFWMLIILWAIFGLGYPFIVETPNRRILVGGNLLLFVLIVLLGLQVFGSAVKG